MLLHVHGERHERYSQTCMHGHSPPPCIVYTLLHIPQQMRAVITWNFVVIDPNTITSFLNMSMASAPIQNTDTNVVYWMERDMMVQATLFSTLSIPIRKTRSMRSNARLSCTWNLLASLCLSFLWNTNNKVIVV